MALSFMNVDVTKQHSLPLNEAKKRAEKVAKELKASEFLKEVEYAWDGNRINFQVKGGGANGVKGYIDVTASSISVHIELTAITLAGKPWLEANIPDYFARAGIA